MAVKGKRFKFKVEWLIRLPAVRDHQTPDHPSQPSWVWAANRELAWLLFRHQSLNLSFAQPCDENPPLRTSSPLSNPVVAAQAAIITTATA
jgi:hypothetical protein